MGGHGHKRSRVERRARGQKREPTAAEGGDCGVCWCGEREIMDRFQNGQHTLEAAGGCARQLIMRRESVVI